MIAEEGDSGGHGVEEEMLVSAWAPPPTAPRPSSVGTPIAAVKLPSLPPPTATPVDRREPGCDRRLLERAANSSAEALAGIGGRPMPPVTSSVAPGTVVVSDRIADSTRAVSSADSTRASTLIVASAGTTLSAVPALATVGVTVVPAAGSPKGGDRRAPGGLPRPAR